MLPERLLGLCLLRKGAIDFFLGADIGGVGSTMHVESKGEILHWKINKPDGTCKVIDINRKDSNRY